MAGKVKDPFHDLVGHEECLQVFKDIGPKRSHAKIIAILQSQGRKAPAHNTIKSWAVKFGWPSKVKEYDLEVAKMAEREIQEKHAEKAVEEVTHLATKMRSVSNKILSKLELSVPGLKVSSGNEVRALAEGAVALNKAAEVLDGGVSDRTENRETLTIEERKSKAMSMVDDAFKKFTTGGQDNGKRTGTVEQPVGDAGNARTGTRGL